MGHFAEAAKKKKKWRYDGKRVVEGHRHLS